MLDNDSIDFGGINMEHLKQDDKVHLAWMMRIALGWEDEQWTKSHPWPAATHPYMSVSCALSHLAEYAQAIPLVMAALIKVSATNDDNWIRAHAFDAIHNIDNPPDWHAVMGCLAMLDFDHVNDGASHVAFESKPYFEQTCDLFRLLRPDWVKEAGIQ